MLEPPLLSIEEVKSLLQGKKVNIGFRKQLIPTPKQQEEARTKCKLTPFFIFQEQMYDKKDEKVDTS